MDFLIIGAMKSGTSSLWALMRDHPDIWMPLPKELPFFNRPEYERGWDEFARRNLRGMPQAAKVGKATPAYMSGALLDGPHGNQPERDIPERIARLFPDIKLIAILRDPVERALSHFAMTRNVGAETRDVETTFEELLKPEVLTQSRLDPHRLQGYVVQGEYGRILRGYTDVFGADQLLTLSTAQLSADPASVLASVWSFIGVPDHQPADPNRRYMVSAELTRKHRFAGVLDGRRPVVRAVRKAARALPPSIGGPLRRLYWAVLLRSVASEGDGQRQASAPKYDPSPELRQRLAAHYESDSADLEEMFGWAPLSEDSFGSPAEPNRVPAV